MSFDLKQALRDICAKYKMEPIAVLRRATTPKWPLTAGDDEELLEKLKEGGHLLPLPKEPAALANVLETSVREHVLRCLKDEYGIIGIAGGERAYPDIEVPVIEGDVTAYYAVDIKVARRNQPKTKASTRTDSRITLYTGNTYFKFPDEVWGTPRSFNDYQQHLDIIVLYDLVEGNHRVDNAELLVHEPWEIASRSRSSTTREYIGAVDSLADLRAGKGEFKTPEEFYKYWRAFPFKTAKIVEQKLLKAQKELTALKKKK